MVGKTDISKDLAFLNGRRGAMVAALREWCAINTGSLNLDGLGAMRAALRQAFAALGADIEEVAAAPQEVVTASGAVKTRALGSCLRIIKRPQAPVRVLLAGHMDTVFAADHPFQHIRMLDEDTLNAPGAADMKGGLLVMLRALECVERSAHAEKIGYEVLINADEEIGSFGSAPAMSS